MTARLRAASASRFRPAGSVIRIRSPSAARSATVASIASAVPEFASNPPASRPSRRLTAQTSTARRRRARLTWRPWRSCHTCATTMELLRISNAIALRDLQPRNHGTVVTVDSQQRSGVQYQCAHAAESAAVRPSSRSAWAISSAVSTPCSACHPARNSANAFLKHLLCRGRRVSGMSRSSGGTARPPSHTGPGPWSGQNSITITSFSLPRARRHRTHLPVGVPVPSPRRSPREGTLSRFGWPSTAG